MSDLSDDHSTADLVQWLRNQYARHHEIEDKLAADELERLTRERDAFRAVLEGMEYRMLDKIGSLPAGHARTLGAADNGARWLAELEAVKADRDAARQDYMATDAKLFAAERDREQLRAALAECERERNEVGAHANYLQRERERIEEATLERCALACIDQPQSDGSTYTYWPCVNAIRALAKEEKPNDA